MSFIFRRYKAMIQNTVRQEVRLAKAYNSDIYYKDFAEYLGITERSFYNWLYCEYSLSCQKLQKLHELVIDLIE